ncbi:MULTISPECIES: HD domain-containing protein [Bacillus]|uniref:HD domain-containing protein n=1 Tax=Bacillus TaxID=1386 RepID=UPI0002DFE277|nr:MULTISPECIES: HD domain-containing protein [Bacillus]
MKKYDQALAFATKAHNGQTRKNSSQPYIEHPIRVAGILKDAHFREEVVIAALLHDVVEDCPVTIEEIKETFGKDVATIVAYHTENKALSWEERKQHTIEVVQTAPLEVKALIVADKLDNLQSLIQQYDKLGEKVWTAFKRGKKEQAWYNKSVVEAIKDIEDAPEFFKVYQKLVEQFFN